MFALARSPPVPLARRPWPSLMKFDKRAFLQRAFLAFTTGLFLACSAHLAAQPGGFSP